MIETKITPPCKHCIQTSTSYSPYSSYSHFYMGSMYNDKRHHVHRSPTSSADSPSSLISSFTLFNHLLLCITLFLLTCTFSSIAFLPREFSLLSSHHKPVPLQPPFLNFLCDFPHFRYHPYSLISDFVQLRNSAHPSYSILISAISHFFSCAFSNADVAVPV